MYSDCIGNLDIENLPYSECIYCYAGTYYEGSGSFPSDDFEQFLREDCGISEFDLYPAVSLLGNQK